MTICQECKCPIESDGVGHAEGCKSKPPDMVQEFFKRGWTCPKCDRVWSPITDQCKNCNKDAGKKQGELTC